MKPRPESSKPEGGCLPASRVLEDPGAACNCWLYQFPFSLNLIERSFLSPAKAENPENTGQDSPRLGLGQTGVVSEEGMAQTEPW